MSIVHFEEHETFTKITMDDGKANAVSFAMADALDEALDSAAAAGKVLVVTGREGKFSAGFDLSVMGKQDEDSHRLLRRGADIAGRFATFDTPVVGAITGHALAMGALFCLSMDYRVGVSGNFKLGLNEVAIGMTLPWFGIELANARVPAGHLHQVVSLAKIHTPEEAAEAGILDTVVPEIGLMPNVEQVVGYFANLDMTAFKGTKARMRSDFNARWAEAIAKDFG